MTAIARKLAFQVLLEVADKHKYANLALQQVHRSGKLNDRDRALCTEIVYGTVQRQRTLDALLQPFSKRVLKDLDSKVLTILRMTAYQLSYLTRIPSYAALNDAVELCKKSIPKAAGFVNGVLRAYTRDTRSLQERVEHAAQSGGSWADKMGIVHSYPTWIVETWETAYGRERTVAIMEACNTPVSLAVRVNTLRTTPDQVLSEIHNRFGEVARASALTKDGIRFLRGIEVERWEAVTRGQVTVQDEGAMLISPLVRPHEHPRILDMCAGLGTKSTHLAALQGDNGQVDACDIHPYKLRMLKESAERLGITSIRPVVADARALPNRTGQLYDAVLLDAPCTGLGVLRHRPDIRWHRAPADVMALVALQTELVQAAAAVLKPGGVLVYSTCSLLPQENEALVESVVSNGGLGLTWDSFAEGELPAGVEPEPGQHGVLLTPEKFNTDGFYMARLRKMSHSS